MLGLLSKMTGRCSIRTILQVMLAFGLCTGLSAQQLVRAIEFNGLSKTKASFLQQYMTTSVGQMYDSVQLANDKQRLLNLGILAAVGVEFTTEGSNLKLIFNCREMINTLPVFALGKTEDTFWCKAGIQSLNLTGRGDELFAYYQYYDRHSIYINYATDRIGNSRWGTTASLIKWATVEPLNSESGISNYNYTNYTGYASAVRFLSFREALDFGVGVFNERFKAQQIKENELGEIVQGSKLLSKLIFKSNHLDYHSFYVNGIYNQFNVEFIHSLDEARNFTTIFNDFRFFKQIGKRFNWANRLRTGIATNDDNPFAPFVLDSYLNIRGVGNRVDRGTGSVVINTELRYTLFDRKILAAQGVGFFDFGSWRKPGGSFRDFNKSENMRAFSGVGFRMIYKQAFDTMLRVDYGYDYSKNAGLVIGIGQYF
jgi:outer membrane protein insertion porin family